MKNIKWLFLPLLMVSAWGCHNDGDEPQPAAELYLLRSDSLALARISKSFKTDAPGYPAPWSISDRASWKGSIELDTLIDSDTGVAYLTVGALTLYIPEPADPMNEALALLNHVRDFKLYACPDAIVNPGCIPAWCDSIVIDKIDPDAEGYIRVPGGEWDQAKHMILMNWTFAKEVIRGTDIHMIDCYVNYDAIIDNSHNQLDGLVDEQMGRFPNQVNLSHNRYTGLKNGWDYWIYGEYNIPNLQYNEIPIPEEILDTDFWRKNHECFIGNPGYQPPK